MRDLTEEEFKLAPDWATHYFFYYNGNICFESKDRVCKYSVSKGCTILDVPWQHTVRQICKLIPKKPFDITKHEFSDTAKDCHILFNNPKWVGDDLQIEMADSNGSCVDGILIKEHAIAIAKHFKLTGEDLK